MSTKRIISRQLADQDANNAVDYYQAKGSARAALGFIDALERAYAHISRHPRTGSSRYAHELDIPELKSWTLTNYPYTVMYMEHDDHIDILRILHHAQDIPEWLQK